MTDEAKSGEWERSEEAEAVRKSLRVIGEELCHLVDAVAPAEAKQHFKQAHLERLKGVRALIDHRIERLSAERPKGTTIPVE